VVASSVVFAALLGSAAAYDVGQRRVPNWLNLLILVSGLGVGLVDEGTFGANLLTVAVAFGTILPFFHFRVYRGGDAKLLIACGAWFDVLDWFVGFALGMALGAVYALVVIIFDRKERAASLLSIRNLFWSRLGTLGEEASEGRPTIPMAVSFGLAMVFVNHVDVLNMF
jgi:Flp pilus assembly protein protease CpaA